MSMKSAIISKLSATTAITDLTSTRIAWGFLEQGAAMPYVICHLISGAPLTDLGSTSYDTKAGIQIDSVASTPLGAYNLSDAIKTALNTWGSTTTSPEISEITLTNELDDIDGPVPPGSDRYVHRVIQDYSVWYV